MFNLKLSITILLAFIIYILGVANIDRFQESVLDLTPAFFIIVAVVIFSEINLVGSLNTLGVNLNYYAVTIFWMLIYIIYYNIFPDEDVPIEIHIIQSLLVMLSSLLAYDVSRRLTELDKTLEGLSTSTYPNRVLKIQSARDLISAEITRSRRYHHPLAVLVLRLDRITNKTQNWKEVNSIANEILERFTTAKTGKILSDLSRDTDLVLQDGSGQFVLLCPETDKTNVEFLAKRIRTVVKEKLSIEIDLGSSVFPDEALTFDDLLHVALDRSSKLAE